MTISAFYTKALTLLVLVTVAGCSQPVKNDAEVTTKTPIDAKNDLKNTTASEIREYKKAMLYLKKNKLEKSKAILIEFIEDRPSLAGPWANLGLIYLKQNQLDKAEDAVNKALERNPKQAHSLNLLGFIESKKGNFLAAEKHYLKAISYKKGYSVAHYNLALLYDIYFQDIPKAIQHYTAYLKLTGSKDKKTADWVKQLKNTLKKG